MKILWLIDELQVLQGTPVSQLLASYRYRTHLPARGLEDTGNDCMLASFERVIPDDILSIFEPDIVVIGKLLLATGNEQAYRKLSNAVFEVLVAAKARNITTLCDVNDDHFRNPEIGAYWRRLVNSVDRITVGTASMATTVSQWSARPIYVVGDPLGVPEHAPKVFSPLDSKKGPGLLSRLFQPPRNEANRLRCLWFGSHTNWPSMARLTESIGLFAAQQPLSLTLVTTPSPTMEALVRDFNARYHPQAMAQFIPWSEEATITALADAQVVFIPSDSDDPKKSVKTSNRLTDSLHSGCFVLATPLPAYQPYQAFTWQGDDLLEGLRWYLDHPEEAKARIIAGQATVKADAALPAIAERWQAIFNGSATPTISEAAGAPVSVATSTTIKLNLGCGDKILEGYVNVDVAAARAGKTPDVLCDLRDLSIFPDNHADEILSVHVVEHFWRWEVEAILKEWLRVLKPGGKMILECPNLLSACQALLANPSLAARHDQTGQRSMWVFYGDPAWEDPLMIHRWGYTPESLSSLLESVGLVRVRQEPAQYKLREPRDMRIVGEKPFSQ